MGDTEPQTAAAKVLWHFTMSLDGFVAGPEHDMHWLTGVAVRPGLIEEYTRTTGAVLAGRDGFDSAIGDARPYGGAWQGPIFVLTHHPEDARPADGITVLSCPVEEAVQIALDAAGGKNVEVFSPTIGRQLLERGLIDEIDLHVAPILLGAGIRLYDNPADDRIIRLHRVGDGDPASTVNVRYRPVTTGRSAAGSERGPGPRPRGDPVLRQVAEGVLIHQSEFCQSNAVVVHGRAGVLLIDPGILGHEMAALANDLSDSGQTVVAGFSTHPHWDHLLWHARLGAAPRYGTARCAAYCPGSAVGRGCEGPHRRADTAGHRRAGTAGPARPHHRPARRDGADSLGRPSSPDHRASSACPGPCGTADRGTPGPRRRRHAFRRPDSDARPERHRGPDRGLPRRAAAARGRGGRRRCRHPRPRVYRRS